MAAPKSEKKKKSAKKPKAVLDRKKMKKVIPAKPKPKPKPAPKKVAKEKIRKTVKVPEKQAKRKATRSAPCAAGANKRIGPKSDFVHAAETP